MLFLYLLPLAITRGGASIDRKLGLPPIDFGTFNHILGGLLMILGFSFALWSIYDQFLRASGTPLPILHTQKLLVGGPLRYCRNPMTLGEGITGLVTPALERDVLSFFELRSHSFGGKTLAQYLERLRVAVPFQEREEASLRVYLARF